MHNEQDQDKDNQGGGNDNNYCCATPPPARNDDDDDKDGTLAANVHNSTPGCNTGPPWSASMTGAHGNWGGGYAKGVGLS